MPTLQTYRDYHSDATKKVSENTRTLALSAIAIVWLYKVTKPEGGFTLPEELITPLLLVFFALAADFSQYLYGSIAWHIIFRLEEVKLHKGLITEDSNLEGVEPWILYIPYILFYGKTVLVGFAYYYLLTYFLNVTTIRAVTEVTTN
ncbi:hypothetical protein [Methylophilus sp. 3sh_L]|uniref:hypothetical protein n=1 Tax=Methylophilus sp. 3sh_L TaxID=3377114 RepID=UPI00398E3C85